MYVAVPNCRVPFKHCLIGGFVAALAFHFARSMFTDLVVGSSYTFIYGAFAAVPLFLLWIYLSWNIVLMGGILVHSLSAYQNEEQANRPLVLKALDVLYLFWQRQETGQAVGEIELLNRRHDITRGLDSDSWQLLRDIFLKKKLIAENDRGQYLLSRDLHTITFSQLKEWVNSEYALTAEEPPGNLALAAGGLPAAAGTAQATAGHTEYQPRGAFFPMKPWLLPTAAATGRLQPAGAPRQRSATGRDLRGQWVVINYWAIWCKPCIQEIPELNALAELPGVAVLGVNYDGAAARNWSSSWQQTGYQFPHARVPIPPPQLGIRDRWCCPPPSSLTPPVSCRQTLVGPQTLRVAGQASDRTGAGRE